MLIGTYVLGVFGISLPIVRIGGGLLVAATAWHMLHHTRMTTCTPSPTRRRDAVGCRDCPAQLLPDHVPAHDRAWLDRRLDHPRRRFPAIPIHVPLGVLVAACGAALVSVVVYLIFQNSGALLARLGKIGTLVMIRLMASSCSASASRSCGPAGPNLLAATHL